MSKNVNNDVCKDLPIESLNGKQVIQCGVYPLKSWTQESRYQSSFPLGRIDVKWVELWLAERRHSSGNKRKSPQLWKSWKKLVQLHLKPELLTQVSNLSFIVAPSRQKVFPVTLFSTLRPKTYTQGNQFYSLIKSLFFWPNLIGCQPSHRSTKS